MHHDIDSLPDSAVLLIELIRAAHRSRNAELEQGCRDKLRVTTG